MKKVILIVGSLLLILILFLVGINLASYYLAVVNTNQEGFLDVSSRSAPQEVVSADTSFEIYLRSGYTYTTELYSPDEVKNSPVYELSYDNGKIDIIEVKDLSVRNNIYDLSLNQDKKQNQLLSQFYEDVSLNKKEAVAVNEDGDKLVWTTDKNFAGGLKVVFKDGREKILIAGGIKKKYPAQYIPLITNIQWINNDLILINTPNLEAVFWGENCRREHKYNLTFACSDMAYQNSRAFLESADRFYDQYKSFITLCDGTDKPCENYMYYNKESLIVMNVSSGEWFELTTGVDPQVKERI